MAATTDAPVIGQSDVFARVSARSADLLPPMGVFLGFLGLWYLFATVILSPNRRFLVPTPHEVMATTFGEGPARAELLLGLWSTTKVSLTGLLFAILIGGTAAIAMSQARWVERSLYPYAVLLQVVPVLAIVPLLGLMFGFTFRSRVIVCTIIALFPIITNTLFGLKAASPGMRDLFQLHRSSRWTRFRKLDLPAALPAIFTGFRISAGLSVVGAIVGDFFFRQGESGLGVLLDRYRAQLRTEELYGAIFWSAVLGLVVFWMFGLLAKKFTGSWADTAAPTKT